MVNNVNIVVNNLILKYVEDDIVLSVNITSAECYTVDDLWDRAFMDIIGESEFKHVNECRVSAGEFGVLVTALGVWGVG